MSMESNIVNSEAARLAYKIAAASGRAPDSIVLLALQYYEARNIPSKMRDSAERRRLMAEIDDIADHCASLPTLDFRPSDEILYDEAGLPK